MDDAFVFDLRIYTAALYVSPSSFFGAALIGGTKYVENDLDTSKQHEVRPEQNATCVESNCLLLTNLWILFSHALPTSVADHPSSSSTPYMHHVFNSFPPAPVRHETISILSVKTGALLVPFRITFHLGKEAYYHLEEPSNCRGNFE